LVRHAGDSAWVELLEIPGVRMSGLRAWVPASAVRLNAFRRHGLAMHGPLPGGGGRERWYVAEVEDDRFRGLGIRPGDELSIYTDSDSGLQEALAGVWGDVLEAFVTGLYRSLATAAQWPSARSRGQLEVLRGGLRVTLEVPGSRKGLFCECDHCDVTSCDEGLSELLGSP
jgi:hypothetical protein